MFKICVLISNLKHVVLRVNLHNFTLPPFNIRKKKEHGYVGKSDGLWKKYMAVLSSSIRREKHLHFGK